MRHHADEIIRTIPGVDAGPIGLDLGRWGRVVIHRPCLRDYLRYEAEWTGLIGAFLPLFRGVGFLTAAELADQSLKSRFVRELIRAVQNNVFLAALRRFARRWTRRWSLVRALISGNGWTGLIEWPGGINPSNFDGRLTYSQICEVLTLFHQLIVSEKKNTSEIAAEVAEVWRGYSIFAPPNGDGVRPRFGTPKP